MDVWTGSEQCNQYLLSLSLTEVKEATKVRRIVRVRSGMRGIGIGPACVFEMHSYT